MSSPSLSAPFRRAASRVRRLDRPIALLAGMAFITQLGVSVMLPLLPLYALSLGATPFVLGLMVSGFAVMLAIGQLAAGFLAERLASRRLVIAGLGIYAAANIGIAVSASAVLLVGYRGLAGLGSGVTQLAERLYITQVAERTRLAFANGLLSAAGAAGAVCGPAIGGLLAAMGDLRLPFVVVGITSLAATIAGWFLPAPPALSAPAGPDVVDAVEMHPGEEVGEARPTSVGRLLAVLFVAQLAFQAAFGAFITTYAPFATSRLGWSTAEIGLVFSLFGLGSVVFGPWLARMADRRGRRLFGIIGALMVLPFAIVYVAELPREILYPVTVIAGAGLTAFEASWFALLSEATGDGRRGKQFGVVVALSTLGLMVGSLAATQLWESSGDIGLGLLVAAVAVCVSAVALLAYPADRPSARPGARASPI